MTDLLIFQDSFWLFRRKQGRDAEKPGLRRGRTQAGQKLPGGPKGARAGCQLNFTILRASR